VTNDFQVVKCGNCGKLLDEEPTTSVENRRPCPECGSTARAFEVAVSGSLPLHRQLKLKARHGIKGKPFMEQTVGDDLHRKTGRWMKLHRVIDRAKNWYREIVQDPETGQVVHKSDEPLTEHRGHGSAKTKKTD
jgi:hypothetical protein